jgi:AcrR family transcriptional regulator
MTDTGGRIPRAEQRRRTEGRVLTEARRLFSELGYDRTTIRAIATAAQTDPGLVIRYFGSKDELFARAAQLPPDEPVTGPPGQVAERLLASLIGKLESEPTAALAMLRSMLTLPEAATEVRAALDQHQRQLSESLEVPDGPLRTALYGAIVLGVVAGRYLLKLDGLADAPPDEIADVLRPCIRALVKG